MKIKKILSLVFITIMLSSCGKEEMNIKISDNKSDFRVEEKDGFIEMKYQDKVFNLNNYEGTTKELVIIPMCTMDEDYVSVTLLTSDNLYLESTIFNNLSIEGYITFYHLPTLII